MINNLFVYFSGERRGLDTVREVRDFVQSRPEGFTKTGTGSFGVQKRYFANYFQLQTKATCAFRLHYTTFDEAVLRGSMQQSLPNGLQSHEGHA